MKYNYYTCDVFTDQRFGGNQLAVLPEASGLNDKQMQQIAREFNFSGRFGWSTFFDGGTPGSISTALRVSRWGVPASCKRALRKRLTRFFPPGLVEAVYW